MRYEASSKERRSHPFAAQVGLWRHECRVVENAKRRVDASLETHAKSGRALGSRPLLLSLAQDARDPPFSLDGRGHARAMRYLFLWPKTNQSFFVHVMRRVPNPNRLGV